MWGGDPQMLIGAANFLFQPVPFILSYTISTVSNSRRRSPAVVYARVQILYCPGYLLSCARWVEHTANYRRRQFDEHRNKGPLMIMIIRSIQIKNFEWIYSTCCSKHFLGNRRGQSPYWRCISEKRTTSSKKKEGINKREGKMLY